jgi:NADP-dependent 3-hydroxy acid dehydrogenase YdfG
VIPPAATVADVLADLLALPAEVCVSELTILPTAQPAPV